MGRHYGLRFSVAAASPRLVRRQYAGPAMISKTSAAVMKSAADPRNMLPRRAGELSSSGRD